MKELKIWEKYSPPFKQSNPSNQDEVLNMKSEEYYINRDHLLKEIDDILLIMDNDSRDNLNQITHEIIYRINEWREKNNLPRYKEKLFE